MALQEFRSSEVGTIEFIVDDRSYSVARFSQRNQRITRPGLDGADYIGVGEKPNEFAISIFLPTENSSAARVKEFDLNRYSGKLVDYKDEHGNVWPDVFVVDVDSFIRITPGGFGTEFDIGDGEVTVFASVTLNLQNRTGSG